jgi:hypothetical protein
MGKIAISVSAEVRESRRRKRRNMRVFFGKTLVDIGKLAIGGLVFGSILKDEVNKAILIFIGIAGSILLIAAGFLLGTSDKE